MFLSEIRCKQSNMQKSIINNECEVVRWKETEKRGEREQKIVTTHGYHPWIQHNRFGPPWKQNLKGYLRRSLTAFLSSEIRSNPASELLLTDTSLAGPVLQNLQFRESHSLQR